MSSPSSKAHQKSGSFPPPALPGFNSTTDPVRLPPRPSSVTTLRPLPSPRRVSPDCSHHLSGVPCPLPRRTKRVLASITSPFARPSPLCRRVGVRTFTFEACSGFTRVTARRIARPPRRSLSRGFGWAGCPTRPLVSYQSYRQLSGWNLPPLVIRAVGAHCIGPACPPAIPSQAPPASAPEGCAVLLRRSLSSSIGVARRFRGRLGPDSRTGSM